VPVVTPVIPFTARKVSLCEALVIAVRLTIFIARYLIIISAVIIPVLVVSVLVVPILVMVHAVISCVATIVFPAPPAVKGYTIIPVPVIIVVHKGT